MAKGVPKQDSTAICYLSQIQSGRAFCLMHHLVLDVRMPDAKIRVMACSGEIINLDLSE